LTVNKYAGFTEWPPRSRPIELNPHFFSFRGFGPKGKCTDQNN